MFAGLCRQYAPSQKLALEKSLLHVLHQIEGVSSAKKVGPFAQDLLNALTAGNDEMKRAVEDLREGTTVEKKKAAQANRERIMAKLGFKQSDKQPQKLVAERKVGLCSVFVLLRAPSHQWVGGGV
jgi:hypothetical protein